ncbi:hypothetical protein Csp2054_06325 [Curtobacterium sp. 'Ferrero']|uniref:LysM peptidoglycan-binding domain-containing protein n=1 Tax=Curtobacterium sp. 'Ferrero' TaxID=2033654 RepID=UPI000BD340AC|nr:LysM domain-containing protein [Curtobacterium sp. 'Ferrero']PCN48704.1 hypothetical protein Csp2054_06325 [Curtobacterium sp. 'Ferrero']
MGRTTGAIALLGVTTLLLSGCSVFGGDDALPRPTLDRTASAAPTGGTQDGGRTEASSDSGDTAGTVSKSSIPVGTVVARTDAVSKSGDTRVHVEVVADQGGTFEGRLSGYRTTNPQRMTVEFLRNATLGEYVGGGSGIGSTTWDPSEAAPTSVPLDEAGTHPDWLHDVVLIPTSSPDDGNADAPSWIGTALAVGELDWTLPNPYPDFRLTLGAARPGAYGYVFDHSGELITATDGTDARARSYQVAHGDDQTTVAKRFGISIAQLRWLNPTMRVRNDGWIDEGTTLNLDPSTR